MNKKLDLPAPTDDELLKAFVDQAPHTAMNDYRHRTGIDYRITAWAIYDFFEEEWQHRMLDEVKAPLHDHADDERHAAHGE